MKQKDIENVLYKLYSSKIILLTRDNITYSVCFLKNLKEFMATRWKNKDLEYTPIKEDEIMSFLSECEVANV